MVVSQMIVEEEERDVRPKLERAIVRCYRSKQVKTAREWSFPHSKWARADIMLRNS